MQGQYNIALVVLSYCVAVITSHVTLELAGRLRDPLRPAPLLWVIGGAVFMGTGIWSMHFIGATGLSDAAACLELAARSGDSTSTQTAWAAVQSESERLYTFIRARAEERQALQ